MSSAPRTLLFVSSRADRGAGGETYLQSVLRHLDRSRFRPLVVLPREGSLTKDLAPLGVDWYVVGTEQGWIRQPTPWYRLLADTRDRAQQMLDLIEREHVDLVHTNSNHRIEGALAANLAGIHHLYLAHIEYQHDMPVFVRFPLTRPSYARLMGEISSRIVTVSQAVADTLAPYVPAGKVEVIHNGLELDDLDAEAARGGAIRKELGLRDDAVLVAAVGRLNPDKGFDLYIQAAHRVLREEPDTHFLVVGGDEVKSYADELRAQARGLGVDDRVHFLGFRTDVPSLLRQSDIFVLSSRREGHPYVLLEAMGCGCPAVASRCAGVDETIVQGETGYIAEIGDANGLANGIFNLLRDPKLRSEMSAAAKKRIQDHFQAKNMVDRLMAAYDRTLAEPRPPAGSLGVDLFLNATGEIGRLGLELEDVKQRLRILEGRLEPMFSNSFINAFRRLLGKRD